MSDSKGAVTRPLHQVNKPRKSPERRYSRRAPRVQYASHNGFATHKPVVLKEGYLNKPSFFRFGARRRRWCVLRSYSPSEAAMDIFTDDSKTRYKGSITLDKESNPVMFVKTSEIAQRRKVNAGYMVLKVGKNTYHFSTDTFCEMAEWCALIRQAISDGSLFSANLSEPRQLSDGMVNVQFTSNYIALLCPVKELSIKRWRLDHITSFGQSGGMLTFECCSRCSDPNNNRASLNIVIEKPATILARMEKSIRDNPHTSEIHYERSILGDIYHCDHHCGSPRMMPAFSDTNLPRLVNTSPYTKNRDDLEMSLPVNLRPDDLKLDSATESFDSGLPGTPQFDEDSPRSSPALPSPTYTGKNDFSLKSHDKLSPAVDRPFIAEARYTQSPFRGTPPSEEDNSSRLTYSTIIHRSRDQSSSFSSNGSGSVTYSTVASSRHSEAKGKPTTPVQLNYTRQHSPPTNQLVPTPPERRQSRFRPASTSPTSTLSCSVPAKTNFGAIDSKDLPRIPFDVIPPPPKVLSSRTSSFGKSQEEVLRQREQQLASVMERDHPVSELGFGPSTRHRSGTHMVQRELPSNYERLRSQSVSDSLEPSPIRSFRDPSKSSSDELEDDSYDNLDELKSFNPFFRMGDLEYDETEGEAAHEICSNLADYRRHVEQRRPYCQPNVIDKVLSKVACDNVRGYAYKIMIPVAGDVVYDVPRRQAPVADLASVRTNSDAPPKPMRIPGKSLEPTDDVFVSMSTQ